MIVDHLGAQTYVVSPFWSHGRVFWRPVVPTNSWNKANSGQRFLNTRPKCAQKGTKTPQDTCRPCVVASTHMMMGFDVFALPRTSFGLQDDGHAIMPIVLQSKTCSRQCNKCNNTSKPIIICVEATKQCLHVSFGVFDATWRALALGDNSFGPYGCHMDVRCSLAWYIHVLSYCRMLRVANV